MTTTIARPACPRYYATYQPDWKSPEVLYGQATLQRGTGYLFKPDGCKGGILILYTDVRLTLGQPIER